MLRDGRKAKTLQVRPDRRRSRDRPLHGALDRGRRVSRRSLLQSHKPRCRAGNRHAAAGLRAEMEPLFPERVGTADRGRAGKAGTRGSLDAPRHPLGRRRSQYTAAAGGAGGGFFKRRCADRRHARMDLHQPGDQPVFLSCTRGRMDPDPLAHPRRRQWRRADHGDVERPQRSLCRSDAGDDIRKAASQPEASVAPQPPTQRARPPRQHPPA